MEESPATRSYMACRRPVARHPGRPGVGNCNLPTIEDNLENRDGEKEPNDEKEFRLIRVKKKGRTWRKMSPPPSQPEGEGKRAARGTRI